MKERSKLTRKILAIFFTILVHSSIVYSHELAQSSSPSPAPVGGEVIVKGLKVFKGRSGDAMRGSFPARCHSKCNECKPCIPVQVSIKAMELKEMDYYYPQVWRCICGNDMFSP